MTIPNTNPMTPDQYKIYKGWFDCKEYITRKEGEIWSRNRRKELDGFQTVMPPITHDMLALKNTVTGEYALVYRNAAHPKGFYTGDWKVIDLPGNDPNFFEAAGRVNPELPPNKWSGAPD